MEKLIEALKTIQDECYKHRNTADGCTSCPFCVGVDDCGVSDTTPNNWSISTPIVRILK